jgi:hypothetical protein
MKKQGRTEGKIPTTGGRTFHPCTYCGGWYMGENKEGETDRTQIGAFLDAGAIVRTICDMCLIKVFDKVLGMKQPIEKEAVKWPKK